MKVIQKYFPDLSEVQLQQMQTACDLYREWNQKINIISRKDIDELECHHILHSLSIAMFIRFKPESQILDLGSGGGFPGIPLAIFFPQVQFTLVDSVNKKNIVSQAVVKGVGLQNVDIIHSRVEELKGKEKSFDFVVSRAVAPLDQLAKWSRKLISPKDRNALPNGLICLKGGELQKELNAAYKNKAEVEDIYPTILEEEYFTTKKIVYLPLR